MIKVLILTICSSIIFLSCNKNIEKNKNIEQETINGTLEENQKPDVLSEMDLFAPVISAYADFIRGSLFDNGLIGNSVWTASKEDLDADASYREIDWDDISVQDLVYAFYDITGNGIPELLIGAKESYIGTKNSVIETYTITGIYILKNGKPFSAWQTWARFGDNFLVDSNGKCIYEHGYGRMGHAGELYYSMDETGELVILDILFTNGEIIENGEIVGGYRSKAIGDKLYPYQTVDITEEEYISLVQHYGSKGYITPEYFGEEEPRKIVLDWKPIVK